MKARLPLVTKLILLTALIGVLALTFLQLYTHYRLLRHFQNLDEQVALEALNRGLDNIQSEIRNLQTIAGGISYQNDDEVDYPELMEMMYLDFLVISRNGRTFRGIPSLVRSAGEIVEIPDTGHVFDELLGGPFAGDRLANWGFVQTRSDGKLYLLALGSSPDKESKVVIGRRLDPMMARYTDRTESVQIAFNDGTEIGEAKVDIQLNELSDSFPVFDRITRDEVTFELRDDGQIHAWISVDVPYLYDGLLIHLSKNAEIRNTGRVVMRNLQIAYSLSYLIIIGAFFIWMMRYVSRPFRILIEGIRSWDGLRLPDFGNIRKRNDELGLLAESFTGMSTDILKKTKTLEEHAVRDALTGLFNRRRFDEDFESEWKRHKRKNATLSLIMADIDRFKDYNDYYGHPEGDRCLYRVAQAFDSALNRPGDIPFRYGGEEFSVILAETDATGARKVAETLRASVENLKIPHESRKDGSYVTLSLGVATVIPEENEDCMSRNQLLQMADSALYEAKSAGRNRVAVKKGN